MATLKIGSLTYNTVTEEADIKLNDGWLETPTTIRKDMIMDWQADLKKLWNEADKEELAMDKNLQKKTKAILINPFTRSITEVEYNGDFNEIYKLIGCDTFTIAPITHRGDGIFIDDEGLFKFNQAFFKHDGYPQPLAGCGLIMGCDEEGETVEPTVSLTDTVHAVRFMSLEEIREEYA